MEKGKEMSGQDFIGYIGNDEFNKKHIAHERVRIEKPEMVIFHGKVYYDLTPYFNMDSSKVVLQRVPEDTPERRAELKRREQERYRITRTWTAE